MKLAKIFYEEQGEVKCTVVEWTEMNTEIEKLKAAGCEILETNVRPIEFA